MSNGPLWHIDPRDNGTGEPMELHVWYCKFLGEWIAERVVARGETQKEALKNARMKLGIHDIDEFPCKAWQATLKAVVSEKATRRCARCGWEQEPHNDYFGYQGEKGAAHANNM